MLEILLFCLLIVGVLSVAVVAALMIVTYAVHSGYVDSLNESEEE